MHAKEFFEKGIDAIRAWINARLVRKVFAATATIAVVLMLFSMLDHTNYVFCAAAAVGIIAVGSSIIDTLQSRVEFKKTIRQLELEYTIEGERSCWDGYDRREIKRKTRAYDGYIALKIFLLGLMVYFLLQTVL